jgi:hypothetical protein
VQVSDFGLTKFREDVGKGTKEIGGSVHWTAPEVLNETADVDLILADVYSFGASGPTPISSPRLAATTNPTHTTPQASSSGSFSLVNSPTLA